MSANYSYHLFFEAKDFEISKKAVSEIILPEHRALLDNLPATGPHDNYTNIITPIDDVVRKYLAQDIVTQDDTMAEIGGQTYGRIIGILPDLYIGERFVHWSFMSVGTMTSLVLKNSEQIRLQFYSALKAGNGLFGVFDYEDGPVKLLPDFKIEIVPGDEIYDEIISGLDSRPGDKEFMDGLIESFYVLFKESTNTA